MRSKFNKFAGKTITKDIIPYIDNNRKEYKVNHSISKIYFISREFLLEEIFFKNL